MLRTVLNAFVIAVVLPAIWLSQAMACTLRLGVETHFPPHIIKTEKGWSGLSVELAQRLAREVDCDVILIESPWLRAMRQIDKGELDIVSHLTFSPERQQRFAFIGPHHLEQIYLVADPTAIPALSSVEQLANDVDLTAIAMLDGAYYGEDFARLQAQPGLKRQLVYINNNLDKMALLNAGRVNAVLEDISVLRYWQSTHNNVSMRYRPLLAIHKGPVYFGFNKKTLSAAQLQQLESAWQKLHSSGELAAIVSRYQQADSELGVPPPQPHL
ncbi:amino acid ABC transporter substrate-binding protein, PAAT family [Arsukibacterium tuosuense]|uniref:Amino acid ABC transporter substrate-binding protein, PAAT family n=1 Tax=Arsukibacterium tuosuense TaxID=1323745 RepID=A0A285J097_9GAMM|nr:transporter substrate-binding domain-containing protein [Arsukibacterium tuosuense]SNY53327.1 amino acid ABC transporter substrate-binding protein, PAAT family [Arsukibacterium tuosuense]